MSANFFSLSIYEVRTLQSESEQTTFAEFISKTVIQNVIHGLEKREKYILNLRFLQGKTQTQVAKIVGISQAQVSRIEKNVLVLVKKQLDI